MPAFPLAAFARVAVLATLTRPRAAAATAPGCDGRRYGASTTTKLNYFNATVTNNTLHREGGELRYDGVGIVRDREVSLVVTVTSGEYADTAEAWLDRGLAYDEHMNGRSPGSEFAHIRLQVKEGAPKSGEGNFRMCLVDTETSEPTKVEQFTWTVFDIDQRGSDTGRQGRHVLERLFMDTSQVLHYQVWPNTTDSELRITCEDGSDLPCQGTRTEFHSSAAGSNKDNPTDPNHMTPTQKQRSVAFTFVNTDCWEFTYDVYCPGEQDGGTTQCKGMHDAKNTPGARYGGGKLFFAGDSAELINEGECLTPPPPPSTAPSVSNAPSDTPSQYPVDSPTDSPTYSPMDSPTDAPTDSPADATTDSPTDLPTGVPTDSPTDSPTSLLPSGLPSTAPTASQSPARSVNAHWVECGARDHCKWGPDRYLAHDDELHEVRCCSDVELTGWVTPKGVCPVWRHLWAQSDFDGHCYESKSYCEALDICTGNGGRLCTKAELEASCTETSGCGFDYNLIWSSTDGLLPSASPATCDSWPTVSGAPSKSPTDLPTNDPTISSTEEPSGRPSKEPEANTKNENAVNAVQSPRPPLVLNNAPVTVNNSCAHGRNLMVACNIVSDCAGYKDCTSDNAKCKCVNGKCKRTWKDCKTWGRGTHKWRCPVGKECVRKLDPHCEPKKWGACKKLL